MVQDTMVPFMDLVTYDDDGSLNDISNYGFKTWLILMNKT
jgi:hypothetical protein